MEREERKVTADPARFQEVRDEATGEGKPSMEMFLDLPVEVSVEVGRATLTLGKLLDLSPGAVIELDKLTGEPVDIFVNSKLFARGEVVVVDETLGVRITEILGLSGRGGKG